MDSNRGSIHTEIQEERNQIERSLKMNVPRIRVDIAFYLSVIIILALGNWFFWNQLKMLKTELRYAEKKLEEMPVINIPEIGVKGGETHAKKSNPVK